MATQTTRPNSALADEIWFSDRIRRGQLATSCGTLDTALSLGGLNDVKFADETMDDLRAALRAYGEWLIKVANEAS